MGQILLAKIVELLPQMGLSFKQTRVLIQIALHVLDDVVNGQPAGIYYAKRSTLLKQTGMDARSVREALTELKRDGWLLQDESDRRNAGYTAHYRINIPRVLQMADDLARTEEVEAFRSGGVKRSAFGERITPPPPARITPPKDSSNNSSEEGRASAPAPHDLLTSEPQPTKGCLKHPNNDAEVSCTACMKQRRDVYEPWAAREQARKAALAKLPGDAPELYREHEHKWTASGHCTKPWCPETNPAVLAA